MPNKAKLVSPEAEQAVLAALLLKPSYLIEILELIRPEDFYNSAHGKIYQAMIDLLEKDSPIEFSSIFLHLKEKGQIEEIGGASFLTSLTDNAGTAANIHHYTKIVHDKSSLRRLSQVAESIIKECQNGGSGDVCSLVENAKEEISGIYEGMRIKGGKNITKRIRDYMEVTEGNVAVTEIYKSLGLVTLGNKKAAQMALGRMVQDGYLTRIKPGIYRVIEKDTIRLKLSEAKNMGPEIDMRYPFNLERWFITYPKTVILVSGEPDAGKTAIMLNIARLNMHLAPEYYWTSEMGLPELYSRVSNFDDFNEAEWDRRVEFNERSENFADVVGLYPDAIHLIDNLEMDDNFYEIGGIIDAIWRALGKGVAIIALHKDPNKSYGLGGMASIKRPRLWLDLKPKKGGGNIMRIGKFKNWRDKLTNIKEKEFEYRLVKGCKIIEWE